MRNFIESLTRGIHPEDGRKADLLFILTFTILCFGRLLWMQDMSVDDNCWVLAAYNTTDLSGYLDMGARALRRTPQGILCYGLWLMPVFFDHAVLWWRVITLAIHALTAVGIYFLVRGLPGNFRFAAFASACFFIIAPVDTTLPVFTNLLTRIGLLLSVFSLIWTLMALRTGRKVRYLLPALLASVFSNYFLVEAGIALEPARFLLMAAFFRSKGESLTQAMLNALKLSMVFALSLVPLVIYKLNYKPYGVYSGSYETGLKLIFRYGMWEQAFRHFSFDNWKVLKALIEGFPGWAAVLGLAGGFLGWLGLGGFMGGQVSVTGGLKNGFTASLGLTLLIFPLLFYMYAGKVPSYSFDTRHGILMQLGNAVMLGGLLSWLAYKQDWTPWSRAGVVVLFVAGAFFYNLSFYTPHGTLKQLGKAVMLGGLAACLVFQKNRKIWLRAGLAALFAAGAFFNNLNLDQYFNTWEQKRQFWRAFEARFPELPPKADFVIGVENQELLYRYYAGYDFEYAINLLYSRDGRRGSVRAYRVIPAAEFTETQRGAFKRPGHYGEDVFETGTLIPVAFKNGRFYSGKETAVFGGVYKLIAGNPLPGQGRKGEIHYPLRHRAGYLD